MRSGWGSYTVEYAPLETLFSNVQADGIKNFKMPYLKNKKIIIKKSISL